MATLYLTVGLPGSGKTTRAHQLAEERSALRLTPDEWMIPLFGASDPDGKRDVMEGRLLWLALEALKLGTDVVLDFGCWSRNERSAIRWLAHSVGSRCHLVYMPVDHETQLERIAQRQAVASDHTFPISEADLLRWRALFEVPDHAELEGHEWPVDQGQRAERERRARHERHEIADPPPGWPGWLEWAADR
ncbi:AAA family ATPase [Nocardiopsis salina]|uniref:AAA family ATPase n=1 Tax=Nocardiopsis salina TaxID=245836 RepID=UPI000349054B|nr:ATP-binding protein [Nocardiopsis salina]